MVEWKGIRFYRTEAESFRDAPFSAISVDMSINEMRRSAKDEITVDFAYKVDYKEGVASLMMRGNLFLGGDEKELDKYIDMWRKDKKMPKELVSPLANIITYSSQVNGVLVARALGIPAPVVPPNIKLGKPA